MPGLGVDSFIQWALEATAWGTAETAGFWRVPLKSEDITLDIEEITNEAIASGAARQDAAQGGKFVRGTLTTNLTYNGIDHWLYGVMGTFTESTPTGGTASRDHWAELGTTLPSFTVQVNRGDIESNDVAFIYTGCKVNRVDVSIPDRGLGEITVEFIGKDETSSAGGSAASTSGLTTLTEQLVFAHHLQSGFDLGPAADTGAYCVKAVNFSINRNLETRFCQGDQNTKEPLATEYPTIEGSFDIEFQDRNVYESFKAFTFETSGQMIYQSTAVIEGAIEYELELNLNRYRFLAPSVGFINTRGVLIANCPWKADSGNSGTAAAGTPDEVSSKEPLAIRTRNANVKANL